MLVGGSSRVPCVRKALRHIITLHMPEGREFKSTTEVDEAKVTLDSVATGAFREFCSSVNPEEAVAQGILRFCKHVLFVLMGIYLS